MNTYSGMILKPLQEKSSYSFEQYPHPSSVQTWNSDKVNLSRLGTHFGYVSDGTARLQCSLGEFTLKKGMYFSVSGEAVIDGARGGEGFVSCRLGYYGGFYIGGPIERFGRLCYINGMSDSVLIAPLVKGDPCLNYLMIPPGIDQTSHTHPTVRIGAIVEGSGYCQMGGKQIEMKAGHLFVLHADEVHSFHTREDCLRIVLYHPDSDSGPSHEDHPMLNRTIVEGKSAAQIDEIRTREIEYS